MVTKWRQIVKDGLDGTWIEKSGTKGLTEDCAPCIECDFRECPLAIEIGIDRYQTVIAALNERMKNCTTVHLGGSPFNPVLTLLQDDGDPCYTLAELYGVLGRIMMNGWWVRAEWTPEVCTAPIYYTYSTMLQLTGSAVQSIDALETGINNLTRMIPRQVTGTFRTIGLLTSEGSTVFQVNAATVRDEFAAAWDAGTRTTNTTFTGPVSQPITSGSYFNFYSTISGGSCQQSNVGFSDVQAVNPNILLSGTTYNHPNKASETLYGISSTQKFGGWYSIDKVSSAEQCPDDDVFFASEDEEVCMTTVPSTSPFGDDLSPTFDYILPTYETVDGQGFNVCAFYDEGGFNLYPFYEHVRDYHDVYTNVWCVMTFAWTVTP